MSLPSVHHYVEKERMDDLGLSLTFSMPRSPFRAHLSLGFQSGMCDIKNWYTMHGHPGKLGKLCIELPGKLGLASNKERDRPSQREIQMSG